MTDARPSRLHGGSFYLWGSHSMFTFAPLVASKSFIREDASLMFAQASVITR
jgi:hypothetical protein